MSFKPFFSEDLFPSWGIDKRTRLGKSAALEELNRCFFIHLGLALDLHPFALQVQFMTWSRVLLVALFCRRRPFESLFNSCSRVSNPPPPPPSTPVSQAIFREHSQLMMTRTKVIVATRCCVLHRTVYACCTCCC